MKTLKSMIAVLVCSCGVAFGQGEPAKPSDTAPKPLVQTPTPPTPPAAPKAPEVVEPFGKVLDYFETTELTTVASGHMFTEGPLWWNGKLLFCDLAASSISTITPGKDASATTFRDDADQPAGSALDLEGRLLVAHFKGGKVTRTAADGTVSIILETVADQKVGKCNDLVVRADGSIYTTDFSGGKDGRNIIRIAPDGKASILPSTFKASNGVAFSPDESVLYVADYGDKLVKAFDVVADGTLSNERVFVDFKAEKGRGTPDGLKVDTAGNLYTTGPGGIWVVSSKGEKLARLDANNVSNMTFGGEDRKTLFITAGSKVYSVKAKHAGVAPKTAKPAAASPPTATPAKK